MKKGRNITFGILAILISLVGVSWLYQHSRTLSTIKASVGEWTDSDFNTRDITRVHIRRDGGQVIVHVWGRCHPTECDWGEVTAKASGSVLLATWDQKFAIKTQELRPFSDGSLQLTTHTHFTDNSGRQDYDTKSTFAKGLVHDWNEPTPK